MKLRTTILKLNQLKKNHGMKYWACTWHNWKFSFWHEVWTLYWAVLLQCCLVPSMLFLCPVVPYTQLTQEFTWLTQEQSRGVGTMRFFFPYADHGRRIGCEEMTWPWFLMLVMEGEEEVKKCLDLIPYAGDGRRRGGEEMR